MNKNIHIGNRQVLLNYSVHMLEYSLFQATPVSLSRRLA